MDDRWIDLASERLGGAAVAANDEFFAPRQNLVRGEKPVFQDGIYTDRGKWMDGWETRRRRSPGHDWCVVRLGLRGRPKRFIVDTTHFKGNAPESCSIDACAIEGPEPDSWHAVPWTEVLSKSPLKPDSENALEARADAGALFTHVRLNIHPDGGVARLRVLGEVVPDWERIVRRGGEIDLAAIENGGVAIASSDEFFGSRRNLLHSGRARDMRDGWETRRRRGPGHDWVVVRLGRPGVLRRIEVDTLQFQGNAPGWCSLDVAPGKDLPLVEELDWKELLPKTALRPHTLHVFESELALAPAGASPGAEGKSAGPAAYARLNIFPDGGVSRLRLWAPVESLR